MSDTPAGWYPDAQGVMRWFDGTSWTEHTQDALPPAPPTPPPAAPPAAPPVSPWNTPGYQSYDSVPAAPAQPPYGQQGYPPAGPPAYQPGAPTPSGPNRRTGLIAGLSALAVLLVAAVVVGAVLLVGGSDDKDDTDDASSSTTASDSPSASTATSPEASASTLTAPAEPTTSDAPVEPTGDTPEAVAEGFMKAIFNGDCDAAEAYVSDDVVESAGSCGGSEIPTGTFDDVTYKVGKADITGDTATVPIKLILDLGDDVDLGDLGDIPGLTMSLENSGGRWVVTDLA